MRLGAGISASLLNNSIPSYIAEIVPKNKIGLFSGIYNIYIPLGVTMGAYWGVFLPNS